MFIINLNHQKHDVISGSLLSAHAKCATSCSKTKMEEQVIWDEVYGAWKNSFCDRFCCAGYPDNLSLFAGDCSAWPPLQTAIRSYRYRDKKCGGKGALHFHKLPWLSDQVSISFGARECKFSHNIFAAYNVTDILFTKKCLLFQFVYFWTIAWCHYAWFRARN